MIYTYKELAHKIDLFHEHISYFFEQLFIYAPPKFDGNLLLKPAFVPVVNKSKKAFLAQLEVITETFHGLPEEHQIILMQAYGANYDIKDLCENVTLIPVRYSELPEELTNLLKDFLTSLWETFPQNELLENMCGTVQNHFNAFVAEKHQQALICPFCGLNKLKTSESINRDAYDHYIPKAFYPFVSINFKNLFPICHECNSDEKKSTDTLYDGSKRRVVTYPLDTSYPKEKLDITITPKEKFNAVTYKTILNDIDWQFDLTIEKKATPQLESWDQIFKVRRRYRENVLRYQIVWFEYILYKYRSSKAKGEGFQGFKDEMLGDADYSKFDSPFGFLKLTYFAFLFSLTDIEDKLDKLV